MDINNEYLYLFEIRIEFEKILLLKDLYLENVEKIRNKKKRNCWKEVKRVNKDYKTMRG